MTHTQRSKLSVADLRDPTKFAKSEYIEALYRVMLQREPDPNGLRNYSRREDVENFFPEILASREFMENTRTTAYFGGGPVDRKRVLLFGAYGNGNLGDAIQATSLLRAIREIREDVEVWACSVLPCQYPYPYQYVLPPKQIYNLPLLNQFDLLLIGGGGLLSHPHEPLTDEDWQRSIDVPIALFGVGAGGDVATKCKTLVKRAIYVSGRDEPSLSALRRLRSEVHFVPDPVLCDPRYYVSAEDDCQQPPAGGKKLWVIKNSPAARDSEILGLIDPQEDQICFVEPFLDFPILSIFPTARPLYFLNDWLSLIDQADMVISMRYHGCILAMLRHKTTIGLFEQKSLDLLTRYQLNKFFSKTGNLNMLRASDYTWPTDKIVSDREIFMRELARVLSLLGPVEKTRLTNNPIEEFFLPAILMARGQSGGLSAAGGSKSLPW